MATVFFRIAVFTSLTTLAYPITPRSPSLPRGERLACLAAVLEVEATRRG